jgi:hypothetical protein
MTNLPSFPSSDPLFMTASDIANHLGISLATAHKMINRLNFGPWIRYGTGSSRIYKKVLCENFNRFSAGRSDFLDPELVIRGPKLPGL